MALGSLWSVVRAATAYPRILIKPEIVEFALSVLSWVTLILFLAVLYQELTGRASASRRQDWALAAAAGMAVRIGLTVQQLLANAVTLRSLPPEMRAQFPAATFDIPGQWEHTIFWSILPDFIWAGFLLVFWREVAPLGRAWTRRLAFVLCLFAAAQGVNDIRRILSAVHQFLIGWAGDPMAAVWNLGIAPAVALAAATALPFFLFSVWRTEPAPEPAQ